jgi:hypothetical protein
VKYRYYRWSCGRDKRLDAVWGGRARSAEAWGGSTAQGPSRQLVDTESMEILKDSEVVVAPKTP